jgi:integrase
LVGDYCQHWLDNIKPTVDLRRRTKVGYQNAINKWIRPFLGDKRIGELSREDIQCLYAQMRKANKSRSSMNQVRAVLSQALDEAMVSGFVNSNLVKFVKLPKKKKPNPIYLRMEDVIAIKTKALENNQWLRWALAIMLGMRQGECLALRWEDVLLDQRVLRIRYSQGRVPRKGLILEELKTPSSIRDLPLSPEIIELFKKHKKLQLELRIKAGETWIQSDHVFTTQNGSPIDNSNDRKAWDKLLMAAGIKPTKLHAARHTTATLLLENGTDIVVVSKLLGHSTIQTTVDFYAHVTNESKVFAINSLEKKLIKNS